MYEYPQLHLHAVGRGLQRVDGRQVSRHERRDHAAHQGGPLGDCGRHVGRAGPEHARRRVAGAAVAGGQALVQAGLRRGRAHRLESGFVWLHVAVAADLQEERHRLFRDAEDGVERHQPVAVQAVLVGVAGWVEGADLLSARLRQRQPEPGAAGARHGAGAGAGAGHDGHDGPLRHRRPRRRTDARDSGRGRPLGGCLRAGAGDAEDASSARRRRYFTDVEKQIAPESRTWNYQSIAKGYTPPPAVAGKVAFRHGRASFTSSITAA